MVKIRYTLAVSLLLSSFVGFSQTDFEAFKKKRQQDFANFVEARDRDFAKFVKNRWEEKQLMEAKKRILTPKPEVVPTFEDVPGAGDDPVNLTTKPISVPKVLPPIAVPTVPEVKPGAPKPSPSSLVNSDFSFYGQTIGWSTLPLPEIAWGPSEEEVSIAWVQLAAWYEVAEPLDLIDKEISQKNLNDWGVYLMLKEMSQQLTSDGNGQRVVTVFLASKMGYELKLARSQNHLLVLVNFSEKVFSHTFLKFDGVMFYIMEPRARYSNEIYSYDANYSESARSLSLSLSQNPDLGGDLKMRNLSFNYKGAVYSFDVPFSPSLTAFLDDVPPVEIGNYFGQSIPKETSDALDRALVPILSSMSVEEGVAFLLHMTQLGFEYETDQDQFGREKYFYPVEILAYPYADCEDRSIFYSWMVKRYLKLDVVGLDYPGHISTAVNIDLQGDYFMLNGKKYVACDPTYINAGPGLSQPSFKDEPADIIWID